MAILHRSEQTPKSEQMMVKLKANTHIGFSSEHDVNRGSYTPGHFI